MEIILFYIKKVISFFIMPYGFAFTLLLISLYFIIKDKKRASLATLSTAIIILFVSSYKYFANLMLYPLERDDNPPTTAITKDIKYIHILGSGYSDDTSLPISSRISESGLKRLIQGFIEYKSHQNSKLIITGYRYLDSNITYTQTAIELLSKLGVPKSDIISSSTTKDTDDEAQFAKSIIGEQRYLLVTSASHMKRAKEIMKRYNLNPIPIKTDYVGGDLKHKLFSPSPNAIVDTHTAMHEYIGMLWHRLRELFKSH